MQGAIQEQEQGLSASRTLQTTLESPFKPQSTSLSTPRSRIASQDQSLKRFAAVNIYSSLVFLYFGIRVPGCAGQLVSWRAKDLHGTTASDCDPLDEDPEFNQSGIAFIMGKNLLKAYERATKKRKADVASLDENDMDIDEEENQTIVLNDSSVQPVKRATMPIIKHNPNWGKYLYASEVKKIYKFPPKHEYENKTKAQIRAVLDERDVHVKKSADLEELIAAALTSDGVDFEVEVPTNVPWTRKQRKARKMD